MIGLIASGILVGIILSLILIGPVFFLLIETSITKGVKSALALEFGVITADFLCIIISHYGSQDLLNYIQTHPAIQIIGGFIIFIYGVFNIMARGNLHIKSGNNIVSKNYLRTFINGFLLNIINIGVVVFWLLIVIYISSNFPGFLDFYIYIGTVFITMFLLDLGKILLANKLVSRLSDKIIYRLKKYLGIILIIFGIVIIVKSFTNPSKTNNKTLNMFNKTHIGNTK